MKPRVSIAIHRSQAKNDITRDYIMKLPAALACEYQLAFTTSIGFGGLRTAQQIRREMKTIYPYLFVYLDGVKVDLENSPASKRYCRSIRERRRTFNHPGELTQREGRQAANAVVQMLEAEVFKKAILELNEAMHSAGWPVRMVLLLHDRMWFSCPDDPSVVAQTKQLIGHVMENAVLFSVPLKVKFDD